MDPRESLRILARNALLVAGCFIACVSIAVVVTLLTKPIYTSTARAFVSTGAASDVTDLSQGGVFAQQVVKSYADVATGSYVLDAVVQKLDLDLTSSELAEEISASAPVDTVVLEITVRDESATRAAAIANAVTAQLGEAVDTLSPSTLAAGSAAVKITQTDSAVAAADPSSPSLVLNLLLGAIIGLALGIAAAALRDRLDTRVKSVKSLSEAVSVPVMGVIAEDSDLSRHPIVSDQQRKGRQGRQAEAFRLLRTNLHFLNIEQGRKALVITSSIAGEGKSTVAANLALSMAQAGQRVLLVDADLRKPVQSEYLGVADGVGLTDVLIGDATLSDAIQTARDGRLQVLTSGRIPPNPSELLQSEAMTVLIQHLEASYDFVLFDAPPLLPVTDAAILAKKASGALIVCAVGQAHVPQLISGSAILAQLDAPVLGVVATMARQPKTDPYGAAPTPASIARPAST